MVTAAAARNNAPIFYERRKPRSVAAVYDKVRHHIDRPIEAYAHLEEARAWAAAWTETIETRSNHLVGAVPAPQRKPESDSPGDVPTIQFAALEPPPLPTAEDFGHFVSPDTASTGTAEDSDHMATLIAALPDEISAASPESGHTVSAARIGGRMPPPAGALVPAVAGTGPFRWLFGSMRSLFGESA